MSSDTGSDAHVPEDGLKKLSIVFLWDKDLFSFKISS